MLYRVSINIDEIDDATGSPVNIDVHQVVTLTDHDQAMKIWNWIVELVEAQVKAADYRLFG